MTRDDEQFLKLGREMVRMIHAVQKVAGARRKFIYPGGECHVFIVNDERLANLVDAVAGVTHRVTDAIPSEIEELTKGTI